MAETQPGEYKFEVLIEISKGTVNNKFEYNHRTGKFVLNFVFENLVWPYNYGFIPNTKGGDGDELDAIVLSKMPLRQGLKAKCHTIGMMEVLDRGEIDNKIICVPAGDSLAVKYRDIADLSESEKNKYIEFQKELAKQKKKVMEIKSFQNKESALNEIKKSKI
jgi:inorganic pyrophosphatase